MRLFELTVLYVLVGLGCAVTLVMRGRRDPTDLVLTALFWPLYAPFLLSRPEAAAGPDPNEVPESRIETELLEALQRVRGTPLAELLPDPATGAALARRLRTATAKLAEIDGLLSRPDFSEVVAAERVRDLEAAGDIRAAAIARGRMSSVRRLRVLRDRFRRELNEVEELLAQLRIQAEVVRIAEGCDDGTRDLVAELLSRVEGLDELLETVHDTAA
jgi:hypothetical protein